MTPAELAKLRTDLKLSVADAAKQIGVDRTTWHRWESGDLVIKENLIELFKLKNKVE